MAFVVVVCILFNLQPRHRFLDKSRNYYRFGINCFQETNGASERQRSVKQRCFREGWKKRKCRRSLNPTQEIFWRSDSRSTPPRVLVLSSNPSITPDLRGYGSYKIIEAVATAFVPPNCKQNTCETDLSQNANNSFSLVLFYVLDAERETHYTHVASHRDNWETEI